MKASRLLDPFQTILSDLNLAFRSLGVASATAALSMLAGCNGIPTAYTSDPVYDQAFIVTSGAPLPMMLMATAVQWNEDYAVTAKHTPFLKDIAHEGRGDLVFIRHKAAKAPSWRASVPGEELTAVGFNSLYMPVKGTGHALPALVRIDAKDGVFYATHDGPTVKGMSGGPVFSDDGQVVGMTVAFLSKEAVDKTGRSDLASSERVSVYMPYSEIQKEWRRYQKELADSSSTPAPEVPDAIPAIASAVGARVH